MVLTSGMALSEATQRSFTMWWPLNGECSARFDDLYENDWNVRSISDDEYFARHNFPGLANRQNMFADPSEAIRVHHWGWLIRPAVHPEQAPLRACVAALIEQLRPIPEVQERIDRFRNDSFSDAMIGAHLRLGDKYGMNTNAVHAIPKALRAVDKYLDECPSAKVFLCTDDGAPHPDGRPTVTHGVVSAFTKRYGNRVVRTTPRSMQRWEPESIQDALVDLMLLRSTRYLVGTADSSFSLIAIYGSPHVRRTMIRVDMPPQTLLRRAAHSLGWHAPASAFTARYPAWEKLLWMIKTMTVRINRARSGR